MCLSRAKHIDLRPHFVREQLELGIAKWCMSTKQLKVLLKKLHVRDYSRGRVLPVWITFGTKGHAKLPNFPATT